MMTFYKFVEVFDSEPLPIDWVDCKVAKGPAFFGKEITKNSRPIPMDPNVERGCFSVGKQRYIMFVHFEKVVKNKSLMDAIGKNPQISKLIKKDMNAMDVSFYRIKGEDLSHGVDKTGNVGPVFSTVLEGIREQLSKRSVDVIVFSSWDVSRTRLYRSLSKRFGAQENFTVLDVVDIHGPSGLNSIFLLVNNDVMAKSRPQMANAAFQ